MADTISLRDLADYISQIRRRHARALRSDLSKLAVMYGEKRVYQALALSQQQDRRAAPQQADRQNGASTSAD